MPAYVEAMRVHDQELRTIADQTDPPTFDNTIVAMERAGVMLRRVDYVFSNMQQVTSMGGRCHPRSTPSQPADHG